MSAGHQRERDFGLGELHIEVRGAHIAVKKRGQPLGVDELDAVIGAEVAARGVEAAFDYLDAPPARVHQVDAPLAYAANLEALALPSVEKIVDAVKAATYR